MRSWSLQTRFLLSGGFLVLITVAGSLWSVMTLLRLNSAIGQTLTESQATIAATASLADILEREDDAVLLAVSGKVRNSKVELARQRQEFDRAYEGLVSQPQDAEQRQVALALREHANAYRATGDALLARAAQMPEQPNDEAIDLASQLSDRLEREDDALLSAVMGKSSGAAGAVAKERRQFDQLYARLQAALRDPEQIKVGGELRNHADAYRAIGDSLLHEGDAGRAGRLYQEKVNPALRQAVADCARIREMSIRAVQSRIEARQVYHEQVNPALRKAIADCARLRELNFQAMQDAGLDASRQARGATTLVGGVALIALGLSAVLMVWLAHGILGQVRELTRGVAALERDDFAHRVPIASHDELGQLAQGFNQMAERLGEYRESSLGELLLAKSTLEATLAALPDAVIVVDPDGRIVARNPFATKILEVLSNADTTKVADLHLPPRTLDEVAQALASGRGSGRPDLSQAWSLDLDGRQVKLLATIVPIPQFLPRRTGAAIVLADVTSFARLDELRGEVIAIASHELKTPLTSLQMSLMLLREKSDNLTDHQKEVLQGALKSGDELAATIEELLDLTRIEAGQLRLARERIDLVQLVTSTVNELRPRFEDAGVHLEVQSELPLAITKGDGPRLRMVFLNLLTNALKYTPRQGRVDVRIASMQNAGGGREPNPQITVTDTGPGIPPELRERIFDKFFRVEDELRSEVKGVRGTGIGLYLCREIIRAHGGTIRCTTADHGGGTRIAITLNADEVSG